ncbi:unnamed protein product [Clonostachys byssicola]|uniref:Major facilitator superfamily (MFS) profile domain-containing protein n=1 Tax=Clonostachys byssicola TaxID=160290 RepID=A0A9N9YBT1_9HYPO|nr:unnamed protein product [Clonostachys byssicola]
MAIAHHNAEDSCLKNQTEPIQAEPLFTPPQPQKESPRLETIEYRNPNSQPTDSQDDVENSSRLSEDISYPEGGLQAWIVVFGSFCAMGAVFGLINTSAVFESYFKENQLRTYTHSEIGWIFSLYLFLVFFVGILVGPIFDRFGPRFLVGAGSILIVASLMLLSLSKEYYQIVLTYSVMGGIGGALLNCPAYGAIAHFFNKRRGLATGIAFTAGGIGGIIFPLLLQFLLADQGVGFGWSCRIMGFIMLILCGLANLCIRSRLSSTDTKGDEIKLSSVLPDITILRNKGFAMAALGIFFMEWGLFVPLTYIVSYAKTHGNGDAASSVLLSLLNAGSVLGRFLPGLVADKLGRFNVIIVTIGLCVTTILAMWLPAGHSKPTLMAFCILFGFASGSNLGLTPVCIGQFCDSRDYGRYVTTANMIASFGTLSSVPIGGALLGLGEQSTGWMALIIFSGVSYVVAMICYMYARVSVTGFKLKAKF